jgi:hypothetical protein
MWSARFSSPTALAQLDPNAREVFTERVARSLGALRDPGPGDVDRVIRQSLIGLWTPPQDIELRMTGRWDRNAPTFERVSKRASEAGQDASPRSWPAQARGGRVPESWRARTRQIRPSSETSPCLHVPSTRLPMLCIRLKGITGGQVMSAKQAALSETG